MDAPSGDIRLSRERYYAVYHHIITAATWAGKFQTPQYDWHKPFTFAWITERFKESEPPE